MHYVSRIDAASAQVPEGYRDHSAGFRRATYVDQKAGSVHMGTGICYLDPAGMIAPHIHSFEETFYIIEGQVIVQVGDQAFLLGAGHYGLIHTGVKHGFRCVGSQPAHWLEMQSPQPRPPDYGRDTFFVGGEIPASAQPPDKVGDAAQIIGYFDEAQLPKPGAPAEMEGFNPTTGVAIKMFVDRSFGAVHQSLFLIQYMPGAKIAPHDHPFEESYFIVSGEVKAVCDGQVYLVGAGGVIWTSVGCVHSFENVGDQPVRWLETQAPLPPSKEVFRFEHEWQQYG
ncbi:MAG: cupin domain-containing protein [Anaerolineae bacterium]|nr:cupin domain-containing protein [Anaerolineae bacterium]